jgi:hypothetical protein
MVRKVHGFSLPVMVAIIIPVFILLHVQAQTITVENTEGGSLIGTAGMQFNRVTG